MQGASGRLEAIWIKRAHGGPMEKVTSAVAVKDKGLEGNADQGGRRQITIVQTEAFEAAGRELGEAVDPVLRRANFLVSGVDLEQTRGRVLRVGDLRIEIRGETRPCQLMDEQRAGLRRALDPHWRAGAFGVVLGDATVALGDQVAWE